MRKRGEMSFNLIIGGIIAVFILILIVALVTGRFSSIFSSLQQAEKTEIGAAKENCQNLCTSVKISVDSAGTGNWDSSEYCDKLFSIDRNGDGSITNDDEDSNADEVVHCYQAPISVNCEHTYVSGSTSISLAGMSEDASVTC